MDEADRAEIQTEVMMEAELKRIHEQVEKIPEGTGECWFCGEPIKDPRRRFCDAFCRDEWERQRK